MRRYTTEIQPRISIRYRLSESQHPNRPEELGSGSEVHRFRVQFGHQFLVKGQNQAAEPHLLSQNEIGKRVRWRTTAIGRKATLSANRRLFVYRVRKGYVRLVFPFLQIATQFLNDALQVLNGRNFVAQWLGQLAGDAVGRYTNRLGNVAQGVFDDRFAPAFTEKQPNGGRI